MSESETAGRARDVDDALREDQATERSERLREIERDETRDRRLVEALAKPDTDDDTD